jgi:hypothetical protein
VSADGFRSCRWDSPFSSRARARGSVSSGGLLAASRSGLARLRASGEGRDLPRPERNVGLKSGSGLPGAKRECSGSDKTVQNLTDCVDRNKAGHSYGKEFIGPAHFVFAGHFHSKLSD